MNKMRSLIFSFLLVEAMIPRSAAWAPSCKLRYGTNGQSTMTKLVQPANTDTVAGRTTNNRMASHLLSKNREDDENTSIDGFQLTTRTEKVIKFDDTTGRFFETELVGEVPDTTTMTMTTATATTAAATTSTVVANHNFPPNELVPTEILFGRQSQSQSQPQSQQKVTPPSLDDIDMSSSMMGNNNEKIDEQTTTNTAWAEPKNDNDIGNDNDGSISIVEECYRAWNRRDMDAVIGCFSDDRFEYQDSLYFGTFSSNKDELKKHFTDQARSLPPNSQIVLDHIAVCSDTGSVGTQWHVETTDDDATTTTKRTTVPYTRGCSFYTTKAVTELTTTTKENKNSRAITSGFRTSEMLIKPSKEFANRLVASTSSLSSPPSSSNNDNKSNTDEAMVSSNNSNKDNGINKKLSIIEQYFDAWNQRDIETALNCFVDDCTYQTEDPVFVDTMKGKSALREHLIKNDASLPSSCQIILDNIAIDSLRGTIGTCWHLEINTGSRNGNGMTIPIPNLRGCSMYTTDPATGLLKSGYDVTESPIKLPKRSTSILNLPARLLFGY